MRIKCLFNMHRWLYLSKTPIGGEWHRHCVYCGKQQEAYLDRGYGHVVWVKKQDQPPKDMGLSGESEVDPETG